MFLMVVVGIYCPQCYTRKSIREKRFFSIAEVATAYVLVG